jgi:biotin transport system substrate-specific component
MTAPGTATLAVTLWPAAERSIARGFLMALAGSLALWLSAKVQVPFWPVPMTMQTLVVLVLGAALGARLGAASVLLYLAEGAAGLPVFAGTPEKGVGLAYMLGPTGGYLLGFVVAEYLIGLLAERGWDRTIPRMFAAMTAGHLLIFLFGWGWLAYLLGPAKAWAFGVAPFYAATLLKTSLAAVLMPAAWKAVRR